MDETDASTSALRDPTVTKEEKWHLMQESEDLQTSDGPGVDEIEEQDSPLAEEIFTAITMIVPFSFLLLMMEMWYGKHPGLNVLVERMVSNVPSMFSLYFIVAFCVLRFFSWRIPTVVAMRYKEHRRLQIGLFLVSIGIGCRMIYLLSRGTLYVNIRQVPPLGTLWIYAIVQLELGPAVLNLAIVAAYVWWKDLKILR
ncbi:hypothetical protein IW261DRAFT_1560738 [Armillaria novae-zelandiae]|uniref:DUF7719 domain-containing protein n=1 Tax=Armillaria novae-zelandiae TaxID=153914 RepID=A0AA39PIT4_9AGAR|nr:hypothetical protein IW261DRAFT_1560738 [Armillaria novae-zelandiae]